MSFDLNFFYNNGYNGYFNGILVVLREIGVIEKFLIFYGFI